MSTGTTGHFTLASWKEQSVSPEGETPRLAHASITNRFTGGIEASDTWCEYVLSYVTETTGTYRGMQRLTGRVDGRQGTFVVEERGTFHEDGSVTGTFEVLPGAATGDLAGLRGTGSFTYRAGASDIPYTFTYERE